MASTCADWQKQPERRRVSKPGRGREEQQRSSACTQQAHARTVWRMRSRLSDSSLVGSSTSGGATGAVWSDTAACSTVAAAAAAAGQPVVSRLAATGAGADATTQRPLKLRGCCAAAASWRLTSVAAIVVELLRQLPTAPVGAARRSSALAPRMLRCMAVSGHARPRIQNTASEVCGD